MGNWIDLHLLICWYNFHRSSHCVHIFYQSLIIAIVNTITNILLVVSFRYWTNCDVKMNISNNAAYFVVTIALTIATVSGLRPDFLCAQLEFVLEPNLSLSKCIDHCPPYRNRPEDLNFCCRVCSEYCTKGCLWKSIDTTQASDLNDGEAPLKRRGRIWMIVTVVVVCGLFLVTFAILSCVYWKKSKVTLWTRSVSQWRLVGQDLSMEGVTSEHPSQLTVNFAKWS